MGSPYSHLSFSGLPLTGHPDSILSLLGYVPVQFVSTPNRRSTWSMRVKYILEELFGGRTESTLYFFDARVRDS